ncbi:MAG: C40 family peptidase [Armatimonadota bacterium]
MGRVTAYLLHRLILILCAVVMIPITASAQSTIDWDAAMASPSSSVCAYAHRLLIKSADGRLLLCQTNTRSCREYTPPVSGELSISGEGVLARHGQSSLVLNEQSGEWLPSTAASDPIELKMPTARSVSRWSGGYGCLFTDYFSLWFSASKRWSNLALPGITPRISAAVPSWDGNCVWFLAGNQLAVTELSSRRSSLLLPWNTPGISLKAIAPAPSGVWVASNYGTMLLGNNQNHPVFVKARMDSPLDTRMDSTQERLVALVEKWQGTPYLYGAQKCQVSTDCSGFVGGVYAELGIPLPRSSQAIGQYSALPTVTDELQIGDLLVTPGHVAMYMGNGLTVEASVSRGVTWGTVSGRSGVVVKRVLR